MKYIFLINTFSLRKESNAIAKKVDEIAKSLGMDYEIRINSEVLSTENILDEYKESENIIVSLGGDGTINRIVNCIYGTKNILSLLPLGTGNDFSRSVNEQMKDGINKIDIVRINESYFINLVCFGVDADIANDETFVDSKIIPRSQRYNASIVTNFLQYRGRYMKLITNNLTFEDYFTTIAVCNGKYYGKGFKMGPNARIDDGLLDVYLFNNMNKISMVKTILGVKKGKHEHSSKVKSLQANKLVVESDKPITCNYDGEKMTSQKFDIEMIHHGLKLYYDSKIEKEFAKIKVKK